MATKQQPAAPVTEQPAAPVTEQPAAPVTEQPKRQGVNGAYYLVNPAGAIHSVSRDHAKERLAVAGWRLATEEEIAAYLGQRIQRADKPIAPRWTADPDKQLGDLAQ